MKNLTLALGSFVLGAAFMFLFGNHTSTVRQAGLAFAQMPAHPVPPAARIGNAFTPIVPPPPRALTDGNVMENQRVYLDGLVESNSDLRNVTLVYGGGAYNLRNARVSGPIGFELIGAAANTAQFLSMFGLIGCPAKQQVPQNNPNAPIMERADLEKDLRGNLITPYSGTE
jgi:hypothetical protein